MGKVDIAKEKKNWVVKSNKFIENKGKLTALEEKILLCVIAKIDPFAADLKTITYEIRDFAKLIGISEDSSHTRIHDACKSLMRKTITYTNESGEMVTTTLMASVKTYPRSGKVEFDFSEPLKEEFIELAKNFTSYMLENALKLQSRHSIRVYELMKQYEKLGRRKIDVEEFRLMLGLEGKYELVSNFERRVVLPSVEEVNLETDIFVEYEKLRDGRSISAFDFTISKKVKDGGGEVVGGVEGDILAIGDSSDREIDLSEYMKVPQETIKMVYDYTEDYKLRVLLLDWILHTVYAGAPVTPPRLKRALKILDDVDDYSKDTSFVYDMKCSIVNQSLTYGKNYLYTLEQILDHEGALEARNY